VTHLPDGRPAAPAQRAGHGDLAGTPSLLREMNVRAALALLLEHGPLSRAELGRLSGLSKVTAAQLLARLAELGLVEVVGGRSSTRGPNADVYGVIAGAAYVAGVHVGPRTVTASVRDLVGDEGPRVEVESPAADAPAGAGEDPVPAVLEAVGAALAAAGAPPERLRAVTVGLPGLVEPGSGDVGFSYDLPHWRSGVRERLAADLGVLVTIDNDVNLAAVAEHREGAARGVDDFVLLWVGRGIGSAIVLSGQVHRGASGAAGELGYLPVPGVDLPTRISRRDKGAFQRLAGEDALLAAAERHGLAGLGLEEAVGRAVGDAPALLDDIAHRLAVGVAAVCAVVDPGLVVLTGPLARAGGEALCSRVASAVADIAPVHPVVVPAGVPEGSVLRGAHLTGLDAARLLVTQS